MRHGEILGGKKPPTLTIGTVVQKGLTHLQERAEKSRKQSAGIREVLCEAEHACENDLCYIFYTVEQAYASSEPNLYFVCQGCGLFTV